MNESKEFGIKSRKTNVIVRRCHSYRSAQRMAWAMNDLCGNQTAFFAVRLSSESK